MLTSTQLNYLRHDLVALATIEYDEVMAELLDHYASLTERKIDTGMSFDDASKWAWAELNLEAGLKSIQTTYEKSVHQQLRYRHLSIMKSYFRCPTIAGIVFLSMLSYQLSPLMSPDVSAILFTIVLISPWFITWYAHTSWGNQNNNRKKVWRSFLLSYSSIPMLIANVLSILARLVYHINLFNYVQTHPGAMTTFFIVLTLFVAGLLQLTREQFDYKLT